MSGFMSYFGARRDPKQSARDAIVTLRQQLQMIEKKEDHLQKKIEEELKKAKANAVSNKALATAALKRKKASELELDRLAGTRLQLEMQVNTLESANLNAETLAAMKKAASALQTIHGNLNIDKVDATMSTVNEQRELANEIATSLANPIYGMEGIDEDELKQELEELEQDSLNERLSGAEHAPVHLPEGVKEGSRQPVAVEDDEEAQLKELQAALAM
ncbi:ESCRT-III subunit protein snf7 [Termitomyces sp. T32_za158]|nr:ESCRT-III subunit protein snf7 [Termitomyces sp. T32_za158]